MVPIEEWEDALSKRDEEEINLEELGRHIWSRRIFIAKITGVFIILGLIVALLVPDEYQAQATLFPEVQSNQGLAGGLLKQYGGLLGISSSNLDLNQQGTIPPTLYPQIVKGLPFQLELLNQKIAFPQYDATATVYDFFDKIYTPSIFSSAIKYTLNIPANIKRLFVKEPPAPPLPNGFEPDSVISVTKDQKKIIKNMQDRITASLDEENGVLTLAVEMPDPDAAAELGQRSIALLKEYVTNYRTQKAMVDLNFARTQMDSAKKKFEEAQQRLATFRDSNRNLATATAQTQEQRLQSEYDLTFNVYNSLAQQVEQAKLSVQQQTPVVSVLHPMEVPTDDVTSGLAILIIITFIGLIASAAYVAFKFFRSEKKHDQA